MNNTFNYHKAIQAINFMVRKEGTHISKLKLLKLLFFAERFHLRTHGRPIFNDEYWAMEMGPVASSVKDIAEFSDFLSHEEKAYTKKFLKPGSKKHFIASINNVDLNEFSDSEIEVLEKTYSLFGQMNHSELIELTHLYPEWRKFAHILDIGMASRVHMSYMDFFQNPTEDFKDEFALDEDILAMTKEIYQEEVQIAQSLT